MTRINIIPPSELTDQHLIAEYREILMVPASLKRTLISKCGLKKERISKNYTLNLGHVYFFYDKGMYLSKRYQELILEMKARGMKPNSKRIFPDDIFTSELFNDWKPNDKDFDIIRERIAERIKKRPGWYKKTKIS